MTDSETFRVRGMTEEEAARYDESTAEQSAWWEFGYVVGQRHALQSMANSIWRDQVSFNGMRPLEDMDDA